MPSVCKKSAGKLLWSPHARTNGVCGRHSRLVFASSNPLIPGMDKSLITQLNFSVTA